jgi:transmembrane sensor
MSTAPEYEDQAATWLVKRDAGGLSDAEQAEFDAWMASDPRARATYLRLELAWKRADGLTRLKPLDGAVDVDLLSRSPFVPVAIEEYSAREETRQSPEMPRRRWAIPLAAAAAALVLVGAGVFAWVAYERTEWREYSTDFGGLERIVLADGSVVRLNTNSVMRVRLTRELRYVVLERGEALFKVAHDKTRPFDVQAGDTVVRAVGTEFSVRIREGGRNLSASRGNDVEVLVREGIVAIDPPEKMREALERSTVLPASVSTLSAGEAVVIAATRVPAAQPQMQVKKIAEAEVDRKLSWTEGRLWFERQTLKDVVAEFNRYNRRQMVIADPAIENLRIGGGFEATDPESFIAALERTLGVRAFPSPAGEGDEAEVIRLVGTQENDQ